MIGVDSDTIIGGDESRQHGGKFKVSALRGVNIDSGLKSIILTAQTEIALITSSFGSIDIKAGTTASMAGVAVTQLGGLAINLGDATTLTHLNTSLTSIINITPTYTTKSGIINLLGVTASIPTLTATKIFTGSIIGGTGTFGNNVGPH